MTKVETKPEDGAGKGGKQTVAYIPSQKDNKDKLCRDGKPCSRKGKDCSWCELNGE